jgi:hypothetical protein
MMLVPVKHPGEAGVNAIDGADPACHPARASNREGVSLFFAVNDHCKDNQDHWHGASRQPDCQDKRPDHGARLVLGLPGSGGAELMLIVPRLLICEGIRRQGWSRRWRLMAGFGNSGRRPPAPPLPGRADGLLALAGLLEPDKPGLSCAVVPDDHVVAGLQLGIEELV